MTDSLSDALDEYRDAADTLIDSLEEADPYDAVGALFHIVKDAVAARNKLRAAEHKLAQEEEPLGFDVEDDDDEDGAPACDLCEGTGFGFDDEGGAACPQCNGTGYDY